MVTDLGRVDMLNLELNSQNMSGRPKDGVYWPFESHMDAAIAEARRAASRGEVPVGAVISGPDGLVISSAGNMTRELDDPTAHAEILAIRAACKTLSASRLIGCSIHVTLEPCAMCAAAISHARIKRLCFGASDPKSGGVDHGAMVFTHPQCHFVPEVYSGIGETEASELLQEFFSRLRSAGKD